jgi:hypothetical protein
MLFHSPYFYELTGKMHVLFASIYTAEKVSDFPILSWEHQTLLRFWFVTSRLGTG